MSSRVKTGFRFALTALLAMAGGSLAGGSPVQAQDLNSIMRGNMAFDAQMNAQVNGLMAQNQAGQQAVWQNYLRQFGPWLRQQYAATGANRQMSFEQFAYYNMMTANGTNVAGGMQAQRDQFAGLQHAARTQQEGGQTYIAGMQHNSRVQSEAVERWTHGAIRGEAQYTNPQTGAPQWMPHYAPGQAQNYGGSTYVQAPNGQYYQHYGNGWIPVQPTGR